MNKNDKFLKYLFQIKKSLNATFFTQNNAMKFTNKFITFFTCEGMSIFRFTCFIHRAISFSLQNLQVPFAKPILFLLEEDPSFEASVVEIPFI